MTSAPAPGGGAPSPPAAGPRWMLVLLLGLGLLQLGLSRRADPDDHARFARAIYMTAARNYVHYGFTAAGGAPLPQGGALELSREAPYLHWPVREYLELGLWLKAFGPTIPVARLRGVLWLGLGFAALAWGAAGLRSGRGPPPALLLLALGSCPALVYYAHSGMPQAVALAGICLALGGRLRARLDRPGPAAWALQVAGVTLAVTTTWEGLLFPAAWALSDLRRRRREGPVLLALALVLVGAQLTWLAALGGLDSLLGRAAHRLGTPLSWGTYLVRLARYGRGLGGPPVLLAAVWAWRALGRLRRGRSRPGDLLALELLLAPVPWFLVFREHVTTNDVEMLYLVPGVALAAWLALDEGRVRAGARAALVVVMVTGGALVGLDIEHRDDLATPRQLGLIAAGCTRADEALATSLHEASVIWVADRFIHIAVGSEEALDALLARGGPTAPRVFLLPAGEEDGPLGRALKARFPGSRRDGAWVFDLRR